MGSPGGSAATLRVKRFFKMHPRCPRLSDRTVRIPASEPQPNCQRLSPSPWSHAASASVRGTGRTARVRSAARRKRRRTPISPSNVNSRSWSRSPSDSIIIEWRAWAGDNRENSNSRRRREPSASSAKKKQLTQEALAEYAGISYEHLNHIENYKVLPSLTVLCAIADALGYDRLADFFLNDPTATL